MHSRYTLSFRESTVGGLLIASRQKSIREYTLELVGLPKDSKDLPPSVTEAEMKAWDPEKGHCCTLSKFRIDLKGHARSVWNKSAAKVFATGYLKKHKHCQHSREIIEKGWLQYVTGLKSKSRLQTKGTAEVKEHKAMRRQNQRKAEVCSCHQSAILLTLEPALLSAA